LASEGQRRERAGKSTQREQTDTYCLRTGKSCRKNGLLGTKKQEKKWFQKQEKTQNRRTGNTISGIVGQKIHNHWAAVAKRTTSCARLEKYNHLWETATQRRARSHSYPAPHEQKNTGERNYSIKAHGALTKWSRMVKG